MKELTELDGNTTSYSMNGIKANARIRVEQDVDFVLKNMKLKILAQPHDEVLLMTDSPYKNYKAKEDRLIPKDGLCSGKILEKQVASNTTCFSYPNNSFKKFCAAYMENLENIQEFPKP